MSDISTELKRQLTLASEEYREEIQMALKQVVDRIGKTGMNAVIISGSLLLSYLLYRGISGPSKSKKSKSSVENGTEVENHEPTMLDRMADKVLEQTLVFLLTLAKERLLAYLNEISEEHEDIESTDGEEHEGREIPRSLN